MAAQGPRLHPELRVLEPGEIHVFKMSVEQGDLEDLIPSTVSDVYSFLDLVWAIRSPLFKLPKCTTFGRYKQLVQSASARYGDHRLTALDTSSTLGLEERVKILSDLPERYLKVFDGLVVLAVDMSTDQIQGCPVTGRSQCTWQDNGISLRSGLGPEVSIVVRTCTFESLESESARQVLLRVKAAESPLLSLRALFMITDQTWPLELIPGVETMDKLLGFARDSDDTVYFH